MKTELSHASGTAKVPPFERAYENIRYYIMAHNLKPGDKLPSEREMSEMWHISRTALRSAVRHLVSMHVLESQHGSGTYLSAHRPVSISGSDFISGFSDNVRRVGRTPSSQVIKQQVVTPDAHVSRKLKLDPTQADHHTTMLLERLRLIDGLPCMLETTYVNRDFFPGIDTHNFAQESLFDVLRDGYHFALTHGHDSLSITKVDEHEAALLGISEGTSVFFQSGIIADDKNEPVEYYKSVIRPDRYAFVNLSGQVTHIPDLGWLHVNRF